MRAVTLTFGLCCLGAAFIVSSVREAEYHRGYAAGMEVGHEQTITPLNNIEEFCDALERLDEDIYLTWVREDGARLQVCVRGKDRQMYAFSRPAVEQPEYIRVSDSKPLWYEDGTYGYKNID